MESGKCGNATVYKTAKGKKAVHQVIHYRYRGPELLEYNMDDYAALICIIPKKKESTGNKRGRKNNATYRFHPDHPLYDSHIQQLRSKPHIPLFVGRPPKPPGPRPENLTASWKKQARRFSRYILILLKPWTECNGQHPGWLTWKEMCEFIKTLQYGNDKKGQTILGRITMALIGNIALGLRSNNQDLVAAQDYRFREADNLKHPNSPSLGKTIGDQEFENEIDNVLNAKEQTASREAFDIIATLRCEAAVDDIVDPSTFKQAKYLTNTAATLAGIMENILPEYEEQQQSLNPTLLSERKNNIYQPIFTKYENKDKFTTLIKALRKEPKDNPTTKLERKFPSSVGGNEMECESSKDTTAETKSPSTGLSAQLNSEQLTVWKIFDNYFRSLAKSKVTGGKRPKPPRVFVHGGPGVGKTFLINAIQESMESHGFSSSSCALTGVASGALPDKRTMHSTFGIKVTTKKQQDLQFLIDLTITELINLRARFDI